MKTFKLTPKANSDYRAEVRQIKQICKVEKNGYRYNKIVYGFSKSLADIEEIVKLGITIEEIPFDVEQFTLTTALEDRARIKSIFDRLKRDREDDNAPASPQEVHTEKQLKDLNDKIQRSKEHLEINGTVKKIKF